MSLMSDLAELSQHLQQERLFVSTEREQLHRLYDSVRQSSEHLLHVAWICQKQKAILGSCISHGTDAKSVDVCGQNNELENTNFVDSYKLFSHHDSKYGELLKFLWENPATVGQCIYEGEMAGVVGMERIITTITASIYGGCMFREDETAMLHILKLLIELQVSNDDNPRRLLRRGTCAFSLMYKQLCDSLFSARLFLTAALHEPIMRLLMEEEWFYDIDPSKALVRFPPKDRLKRFGEPGTEDHNVRQVAYRTFIVDKLVLLSQRFISSIKANLHCFPPSIVWLVGQVYSALSATGRVGQAEVRAACADLIFALFICPAICDPEPYGITSDIPISHITRHNLMQIAQIIQVLALSHWDDIDPKVKDLYSRFEKGCMSSVLDSFLEGSCDYAVLSLGLSPQNLPMRSAMLMTPSDIKELICFLRLACNLLDEKHPSKKQLQTLLSNLPSEVLAVDSIATPSPSLGLTFDPLAILSPGSGQPTTPETPNTQRKMFKGKTVKKKHSTVSNPGAGLHGEDGGGDTVDREKLPSEDVLVITVIPPAECPGMIPEKKVLAWEYENRRRKVKYPSSVSDGIPVPVPAVEIQEKRTRFSLSHDQESIGNTSDCQEAVSEAASSHSIDEDNFSDMMSANVSGRGSPSISGRGSPSISGRDTPLSQAESVEEIPRPPPELPVPVPETVQKQNRVDVTDRFGKFDLERDEIKSTVSDSWSTDVLASDSEPPDQSQLERLEEVGEENFMRPFIVGARDQEPISEISETASDAWSTDVLASDTDEKNSERLQELEDQFEGSSIVDRDEADSSLGTEEMRSDDASLEALGAVGGAPADDLGDLADVFTSASPEPILRPETSEPPRRTALSMPPQSSQSLHPPQLYRSAARQSDPHVLGRGRMWKERQAEEKQQQLQQQALNPHHQHQRTINPGISVWISSNGQMSGNSATDKAQAASMASSTAASLASGNTHPSSPFSVSMRQKRESSHSHHHQQQQQQSPPLPPPSSSAGDGLDRVSQDSGNPLIEITEALKGSPENSMLATLVDLDPDPSEPVNLAEQQNTLISEKRLSVALGMFDRDTSPDGEKDSPSLCMNTNNNNRSVETLTDSLGVLAISPGATAGGDSLVNVSSHSVDSAIELLCDEDSGVKDGVKISGIVGWAEEKEKVSSKKAPPLPSGAPLPKDTSDSISVRSDEKDFTDGDDEGVRRKGGAGFFKTFRDKLHKGIKRKTTKLDKEEIIDVARSSKTDSGDNSEASIAKVESSDDILAKYRTPRKGTIVGAGQARTAAAEITEQSQDAAGLGQNGEEYKLATAQAEENTPFYDPANLEGCFAFQDAKRKLRLVLSVCEVQAGFAQAQSNSPRGSSGLPREHELLSLLKMHLAEAVNLQNKDLVTRLHEVIRCVKLFDSDGCKKLLKSLREEYRNRAVYISYLVRCRQGLLSALSHLQKMLIRVERDKEIIGKHLINVCVRMFIERHERRVLQFISLFQRLEAPDEKCDQVELFLAEMCNDMRQDGLWKAATEAQLDIGQAAVERLIMSRIYSHAIFPNADGDIARDQVAQQHIKKLSGSITPTHKDLRIPKIYHFECPWPAAQHEILMINAYKTPKDKLKCVLRCSQTIMNLLSLANDKSVPAADDFMPVLIFVLIRANPPCLLSTIQYVNSFYSKRLHGEEQYWWMQFCSAVEFIKTMDYSSQ